MNELLLLHDPGYEYTREGGSKMRKCVRYKNVFDPRTGGMVRRCASFGSAGLLGGLEGAPALGATNSLRATFGDVKDVAVTAAIGAGGAIFTDMVFDQIAKNVESIASLSGYTRALAEAATGIAIGIIVGKFLKKPRLGAKLAMGPVVLAALRIAGELLNSGPFAADRGLAGLGMMAIDPYRADLAVGSGQDLGAMQVGPGAPSWMLTPEGQMAGARAGVMSGYAA